MLVTSSLTVQYKEIFNLLKNEAHLPLEDRKSAVLEHLKNVHLPEASEKIQTALKNRMRQGFFFNNFQTRFNKLNKNKRNYEGFEEAYKAWLEKHFHFSFKETESSYIAKKANNFSTKRIHITKYYDYIHDQLGKFNARINLDC